MTLDEAIKHCEEKAKELRKQYELYDHWDEEEEKRANGCLACAEEHEQLAEWLKELRKLKKCRECPLVKEECKLCGFKQGEEQMSNDLISREALKFEIRQQLAFQKEKAKLTTINADKMSHSLVATGLQLAIDIIDNAPPVEARPTGEWITTNREEEYYDEVFKCSVCGVIDFLSNFCPNCGARMKGGEEE